MRGGDSNEGERLAVVDLHPTDHVTVCIMVTQNDGDRVRRASKWIRVRADLLDTTCPRNDLYQDQAVHQVTKVFTELYKGLMEGGD